MKEIISAVVFIVTVLGGVAAIKAFHGCVREAALEKASKGLPSLTDMTNVLQKKDDRLDIEK